MWLARSYGGLVWRFLFVAVITLTPAMAALLYFAGSERRAAIDAAQERAELLLSYAEEGQKHVLEETRTVLRFLAGAPEIRPESGECDLFLARHIGLHEWIRSLRLARLDGNVVCSDDPEDGPANQAARPFFAKVLRGSSFVLSELVGEPASGAVGMVAAVPVTENGQVTGVLSAIISPGRLAERMPARMDERRNLTMFVVDRKGNLVAHHPPVPEFLGANFLDRAVVRKALETPAGFTEVSDLLGGSRLFMFRRLPSTESVLALGVDRASIVGPIDEALRYRIVLITLILSGSLFFGMLGAEALIFRPLRNLGRAAESLERGDFNTRARQDGAREVRALARILQRMAEAVSDRERQLKAARDVAEQALSRASRANRVKTDFLASMSHEIRTPLNGIVGYTERLLDEDLAPSSRHYSHMIQVATSALLTVANDLLDFSSIEAERMELRVGPFSLVALIEATVSIVSHGNPDKRVPIEIVWDPALPDMLNGDEARLRQILLNLLGNAVKFTREGRIVIAGRYNGRSQAGERIRISITDTGIGIPLSKQRRLFERFYQVDGSIRREFGGTGLGLAISKRLIELMGGEIGVDSREGHGSTFWIEVDLPVAHIPEPAPDAPLGATPPARILVAEDVEFNQELTRTLLVAAGHEVDIVGNGDEAVLAVQRTRYDLVLMDVQMPGMDGLTATRRIRALDHPSRDVPIVAMTASALPQQVEKYRKAGMNDHIGKPFRRAELLAKLGQWLGEGDAAAAGSASNGAPDIPGFNSRDLEDLRHTIGNERVRQWLLNLHTRLGEIFAEEVPVVPREELGAAVHALVSQAALLGFPELARLCSVLDAACASGAEMALPYAEARGGAQLARITLAALLGAKDGEVSSR